MAYMLNQCHNWKMLSMQTLKIKHDFKACSLVPQKSLSFYVSSQANQSICIFASSDENERIGHLAVTLLFLFCL